MADLIEGDPYDPLTETAVTEQAAVKRQTDMDIARKELETRQFAYKRVFEAGTPTAEDRAIVKADMTRFCRGGESAYHDNERVHCLLTGRQEVYLRIEDFTKASLDTLVIKYTTP